MNFIKKIQEKPRSTRLLILWLGSFFVMVIVIIIWLLSFSRNFQPKGIKQEAEKTNLPSLFESIEKDFSTFKQGLEGSLRKIYEGEEQQQEQ